LLEQREKVQEECVKLQVLIDEEMGNTTFMWYPDANYINITEDSFRKEKR
jgi:hypothetical protein